jgi:hypothetical protein
MNGKRRNKKAPAFLQGLKIIGIFLTKNLEYLRGHLPPAGRQKY